MFSFKIREDAPKSARLNRPLLMTLAAVVVFLILWAIVAAFQTPHTSARKSSFFNEGRVSSTPPLSPVLAELPKNYQDINAIKNTGAKGIPLFIHTFP